MADSLPSLPSTCPPTGCCSCCHGPPMPPRPPACKAPPPPFVPRCSMHYFRIHPAYWEDRLQRARAMGVNTIEVSGRGGRFACLLALGGVQDGLRWTCKLLEWSSMGLISASSSCCHPGGRELLGPLRQHVMGRGHLGRSMLCPSRRFDATACSLRRASFLPVLPDTAQATHLRRSPAAYLLLQPIPCPALPCLPQAYIPWNWHEPYPGQYEWRGWADVERWLQLIQAGGSAEGGGEGGAGAVPHSCGMGPGRPRPACRHGPRTLLTCTSSAAAAGGQSTCRAPCKPCRTPA